MEYLSFSSETSVKCALLSEEEGTRTQVIDASIKSPNLWPSFTIMQLTHAIRQSDLEFAELLDDLGDGHIMNLPLTMFTTVNTTDQLIKTLFPANI